MEFSHLAAAPLDSARRSIRSHSPAPPMKSFWISGAGGFVGHHVVEHLLVNTDALLFLAENEIPEERTENGYDLLPRYNVVGEEADNLEMAERLAAFAGKPLLWDPVDFHGSRPGHDLAYGLDGSKLAALGWKPPIPLWESLEKVTHWSLAHPQWLR